jgi:hypothetical protein
LGGESFEENLKQIDKVSAYRENFALPIVIDSFLVVQSLQMNEKKRSDARG